LTTVLAASALIAVTPGTTPAGGSVPATTDVFTYSVSEAGSGSWSATNASVQAPSTVKLASPTNVNVFGVDHVYGLTSTGHLIDLAQGGTDGSWQAIDVTSLAGGPALSGKLLAITILDQVDVFGIGIGGTLIEYSTGIDGSPWTARDLSAMTGSGATLVTGPSYTVDVTYHLHLYALSSSGDLIQFRVDLAGGWKATDLTSSFALPALADTPSATLCPGSPPAICLFGRSTGGDLLELSATGKTPNPWQYADISTALGIGAIGGDPTVQSFDGKAIVGVVGSSGSLLLITSPSSTFTTAASSAVRDLTLKTRTGPQATSGTTALTPTSSGMLVASRTASGHLDAFTAATGSSTLGFGPFSVTDVTAATSPSAPASTDPSITVLNGTIDIVEGTSMSPGPRTDVLANGQKLAVGSSLTSSNGTYWAGLQSDGNLMVAAGDQPVWSSNSSSSSPAYLIMSPSGNLKAYNSAGAKIWQVGDSSGPSTFLFLRPDGDLQLVTSAGTIQWTSSASLADRIVMLAETQLGTTETPPGSNCNIYTAAFSRGYACSQNRAEAWCSDFANWAWLFAGANTSYLSGWSYYFVTYGQQFGTFKQGADDDPQPGDAVVWGDMGAAYGTHVATVVGTYLGNIEVISGNDGNDEVGLSGWFDAASSTIDGYSIVGYTTAIPAATGSYAARNAAAVAPPVSVAAIDTQDGGH
jgi:hypothetical protein